MTGMHATGAMRCGRIYRSYEPRSRVLPLSLFSLPAKFIRRGGMTAWLCPRGIPNYDIGRALFSARWMYGRAKRLCNVNRIALSPASSARLFEEKKKRVFSLPGAICPRSRGMSFRVYRNAKRDLWEWRAFSRLNRRIRPYTRFHSCANIRYISFSTRSGHPTRFDSIFPTLARPMSIELQGSQLMTHRIFAMATRCATT